MPSIIIFFAQFDMAVTMVLTPPTTRLFAGMKRLIDCALRIRRCSCDPNTGFDSITGSGSQFAFPSEADMVSAFSGS
jgi:hypothetical protein